MGANCVVIVIDAAAAGHVGAYGYARDTTPNLDRLGASGVVFEQVYSQAPSTILSVASYLTGLQPHTIAVRHEAGRGGSLPYLPQAFSASGFRTAGFSQNVNVALSIPTRQAFDYYYGFASGPRPKAPAPGDLIRGAYQWLDARPDERFFLYLHLLPPHTPYLPPAEHALFAEAPYDGPLRTDSAGMLAVDSGSFPIGDPERAHIVSQYDGNLHLADSFVQRFLDGLAERGLLDRTVVVVTSDHGEAFGEHGRFLHNTTLYDEMLRVPLMFRLPPGLGAAGERIRESIALVDLAPTLEDLFQLGGRLSAQSDGASLVPSLESGAPPVARPIYAQTPEQVAVVDDGWKLIVPTVQEGGREELYDLGGDPAESRNLGGSERDRLLALRESVDGFRDGSVGALGLEAMADSLPAGVTRRLEALGYLLEGAQAQPEAQPEP